MKTILLLDFSLPLLVFGQTKQVISEKGQSLFIEKSVLSVTIRTDLNELIRDVSDYPTEHKGVMFFNKTDSMHIQLRTRGDFRKKKQHCAFPLVRINFKKRSSQHNLCRTG